MKKLIEVFNLSEAYHLDQLSPDSIKRLNDSGFNINQAKELGEGNHGTAFTDGKQVIKLTKDNSEGQNSQKLINKQNKRIVNIYDTFKDKSLWIIRQELLKPLSGQEQQEFTTSINSLPFTPASFPYAKGNMEYLYEKAKDEAIRRSQTDSRHEDDSEYESQLKNSYLNKTMKALDWLRDKFKLEEVLKELIKIGIPNFTDFKAENIGKRGNDFIIFDLSSG